MKHLVAFLMTSKKYLTISNQFSEKYYLTKYFKKKSSSVIDGEDIKKKIKNCFKFKGKIL